MLKDYIESTREPRYSFLFALPLLAAYEALSFALSGSAFEGVRNGADVLLKQLFVSFGGYRGLIAFNVLLLGLGMVLAWKDYRKNANDLRSRFFAVMLGESLVYAAVFGIIVSRLTQLLLPQGLLQIGGGALDLPTQLVVSLGAGIYEELLFRVLLTGGLVWLFRKALRWKEVNAVTGAVLLSALIFSAFHYIGPLGDRFTAGSFTFRAIAGVLFSLMYVTRGLGITAWTHALYDLMITVLAA